MKDRDQEVFAAARPCALPLRPVIPLCFEFLGKFRPCLEDPGGLYPKIRLGSCLALSETEGAVLEMARYEPEDPRDMEVLSSVRGRVLDVLDGVLDDATDPPLTPEPRINSAVLIRRWAHSLSKLGSIRKN